MPQDGLASDFTNTVPERLSDPDGAPIVDASSRLKQEAQDVQALGVRRVRDVTEDFTLASNQLESGELVKDDFFTLFEAVSALEIMDPKMDSGYIPPGDTFEPEVGISSGLEAKEVLWIMDHLFCQEIAWLDGYPLSQTVFTSLHINAMLAPDQDYIASFKKAGPAVNMVLRPFCLALLKCCQLSLQLIQSQTFYDEEDFVTHLFGRELEPHLKGEGHEISLQEALEWLERSGLPKSVGEALESRLTVRIHMLAALSGESGSWRDIRRIISTFLQSHKLARPAPKAFSEKIQRQLATSTPPRAMFQVSFEDACKKWLDLCEDATTVSQLTTLPIMQVPHGLQRATWAFAYTKHPSTLARAIFQDRLFADHDGANVVVHYDLMLKDIHDLVLPGDQLVDPANFQVEVPTDPRHICSRLIESFMDKAIDEYLNLYRMVCQNRCRVRRTFTQAISILDSLESEARNIDSELTIPATSLQIKDKNTGKIDVLNPLSSWTRFYKLRIMTWSVQLGFETEIYLPDELGNMYWFLAFLCSGTCEVLEHIDKHSVERARISHSDIVVYECSTSHLWIQSLITLSSVTRQIAEALWHFYVTLTILEIIRPPKRCFADSERLYEARMKPFLSATNGPVPTSEDFDYIKGHGMPVPEACRVIDQRTKRAKGLLAQLKDVTPEQGKYVGTEEQWKKEIKQLETTCVAISVSASQLLRACEKHGTEHVARSVSCTFERKYHEWWVIPQIKML